VLSRPCIRGRASAAWSARHGRRDWCGTAVRPFACETGPQLSLNSRPC
jgi:hypothetical protein